MTMQRILYYKFDLQSQASKLQWCLFYLQHFHILTVVVEQNTYADLFFSHCSSDQLASGLVHIIRMLSAYQLISSYVVKKKRKKKVK